MKIVFFCLMCLMSSTIFAQSFSSMENVGQYAFNIVQKMNSMSGEQYAKYFSSAKNVYKHVTGEDIPASYIHENLSNLQRKAKNSTILWNKVKYSSFKYYPPEDGNGVLGYKGRLYLQYEGKKFNVVILAIQYEGKYYLLSIY